ERPCGRSRGRPPARAPARPARARAPRSGYPRWGARPPAPARAPAGRHGALPRGVRGRGGARRRERRASRLGRVATPRGRPPHSRSLRTHVSRESVRSGAIRRGSRSRRRARLRTTGTEARSAREIAGDLRVVRHAPCTESDALALPPASVTFTLAGGSASASLSVQGACLTTRRSPAISLAERASVPVVRSRAPRRHRDPRRDFRGGSRRYALTRDSRESVETASAEVGRAGSAPREAPPRRTVYSGFTGHPPPRAWGRGLPPAVEYTIMYTCTRSSTRTRGRGTWPRYASLSASAWGTPS